MGVPRRSLLAALALTSPASASAQTSARPLRIVVGFPPGGSGDFIARAIAEPLSRELGQPVLVDNRPGAGSNLATEFVARAEPDGTTLLLGGNFSHAVNPAIYARVNYDPVRDFTPITRLTTLPVIVAVDVRLGITTLRMLIERVRAEPNRWDYSTPGNGTPSHLAGAALAKAAGISLTHVPFRGGAMAIQAVLAGDVQMTIGTPPVVLPQWRAGRVVALAITTRANSAIMPDIPGTEAAGLPALDLAGWWALWAPARLPEAVQTRLFDSVVRVLADPGLRARMANEGLKVAPSASPAGFDAYIRREIVTWAAVVRDAGATVE